MTAMTSALAYWETLVREDEHLPLFEAALSIAQDEYPEVDLQQILSSIDEMAARLKARFAADAPLAHKLRLLNHFFFNELHFRANVNDYYDTDNSYLNRVLERRCGIPITLSAMYMEIGQQAGLPLKGIAFPGHFLVKMRLGEGTVIMDVFEGGKSLSREELEQRLEPYLAEQNVAAREVLPLFLETASARHILARMLHNLKGIYQADQDYSRLLPVLQRLVVLLPEHPVERRDRGLCYAELDCPRAAMEDLQAYLAMDPQAPDAESVRERMADLEKQIN
ncbi:MAG: SirB1 family protein [Burkholderiales bacterium]|jgi:regulator of sirC expression with transglutaminase-like and TPR domain|nr:tetratricopeptide repeat protein [Burkholderiales bacterium]MCA3153963.1 tetratricopeptide repeat protein [Burkholderiales bacterium]MCA3157635.1 tetratricopeptide repeat protein [Burkholderiales bacterium]MCA3159390.1 tetratricopeptide repeat protein [Burkholderiales bacterium]MCA3162723.1 tetratricopeptide repeat protein [Burkholderiales bacterium]